MTRRALLILLFGLAALPARAEDPQSFAVTTDTAQYCAQLQKQVTDRHSTIPDVQHLLDSGTDMCAKGEIRGGIRRLRHALVILHHHRLAKDQLPGRGAGPKEPAQKPPPKPSAPAVKPAEAPPSPEAPQAPPSQ
jgi:hypothetical protein